MKPKIYNRYANYCQDKKILPFQQVFDYLVTPEEKDEFNEEVITLCFPGNKKTNFNSRLKDEDLRPIVGSYINSISSLIKLDLSFNLFTDSGAFIISRLLENAENLASFNMMGNQIADMGCNKLMGSLKGKVNLKYLNVNTNLIGNIGVMDINNLLFSNPGITYLDIGNFKNKWLGNNRYDWDGLIAITSALKTTNSTLEVLNVDDPQYKLPEQDFFTHFGKMFKDNKGLKKISMKLHKLRFEGVSILTYYLQDNKFLQVLDLSSNQICFQGMMYLSDYLQSTRTLRSIILSGNKIKDAGKNIFLILGAKFFAKGISKNQSIIHADLTNNSITDEGLCRIAEGILVNTYVSSLKVFLNNEWGDESISLFKSVLDKKLLDKIPFYPDFTIYENVRLETDIAYLETHIENEQDYLV